MVNITNWHDDRGRLRVQLYKRKKGREERKARKEGRKKREGGSAWGKKEKRK